ncbi:winged helix-turn-helix transcriptional regulator [Acidisarcina polymorpha]|uniref:winged helix-turn-helix transcriptional regulator n=1 Tax=Acidisarcina polymorpha TaxID=2211140 RepID=UPI00191C4A2F
MLNCVRLFDIVQVISGKWTTFLMMALAERRQRLGELRRLFPGIRSECRSRLCMTCNAMVM